ncbi:MAG TPA: ribosomal protein S18-alanine N-acetyltransferase [Nitrospiraceae bacterium]|nr:ribosomal protein S18-alanine N-acetyltransferase [Nitrospiraceae bacterium]
MSEAKSREAGAIWIEPATQVDLDAIVRIEEACFSAPWTRKMLEAELTGNQFSWFLIAKQAQAESTVPGVVGYVSFWVVFEELRIMNVAVAPSARRQGIARRLVTRALEIGCERSASKGLLEVRASNHPARRLYGELGFREVSIRSRYYTNPIEDAVLMESASIGKPAGAAAAESPTSAQVVCSKSTLLPGRCDMMSERAIAEQLRRSSTEFRELEESHHRLDNELAELQKRHVLTPSEELVKKQLQKEKLVKKDKMAELIRLYKQQDDHSTVH